MTWALTDPGDVRWVFVYGTLMPGQSRWPSIRGAVRAHRPASCPGRIFDTGRGYPAACFDLEGTVAGVVLELQPGRAQQTLALLDRLEGADYARRLVTVHLVGQGTDPDRSAPLDGAGVVAFAYQWCRSLRGLTPLPGRWSPVTPPPDPQR